VAGFWAAVALACRGAGSGANLLKGIGEPLAFWRSFGRGVLALVAALIYLAHML